MDAQVEAICAELEDLVALIEEGESVAAESPEEPAWALSLASLKARRAALLSKLGEALDARGTADADEQVEAIRQELQSLARVIKAGEAAVAEAPGDSGLRVTLRTLERTRSRLQEELERELRIA